MRIATQPTDSAILGQYRSILEVEGGYCSPQIVARRLDAKSSYVRARVHAMRGDGTWPFPGAATGGGTPSRVRRAVLGVGRRTDVRTALEAIAGRVREATGYSITKRMTAKVMRRADESRTDIIFRMITREARKEFRTRNDEKPYMGRSVAKMLRSLPAAPPLLPRGGDGASALTDGLAKLFLRGGCDAVN